MSAQDRSEIDRAEAAWRRAVIGALLVSIMVAGVLVMTIIAMGMVG